MSVKASSITFRKLRAAKIQNTAEFYALDFSDFEAVYSIDRLEELFPKQEGCGYLNPTAEYLSSGFKLQKWRTFSESCQQSIIRGEGEDEPTVQLGENHRALSPMQINENF